MSRNTSLTQKTVTLLVLAALLAGVFAVLQPVPAQAALCAATHVVKQGDTLKSVAKQYGVNYKVLAKTNNLDVNEKLTKGDKLCIPKSGKAEPNMVLAITAGGGNVNIQVSGTTRNEKYLVKAREGDSGPWTTLGKFNSGNKNETKKLSFSLPPGLKKELYLTICLKNQNNDALTCRLVINPG